jgi:sugar-specific transcriptional regulator TrmB
MQLTDATDILQTLTSLGLTLSQAKAYVALLRLQCATASAAAKLSGIPRQDIYRVLSELQTIGLTEKTFATPAKYKPTPLSITIAYLLENKAQAYKKTEANALQLLQTLAECTHETSQDSDAQFILIPPKKAVVERIRCAIDRAQKSVDLILSWKRYAQGATSVYLKECMEACNRNVKFRVIAESPPKQAASLLETTMLKKKPQWRIRYIPECPRTVLGIYDGKEVFIIIDPKADLHKSSALWSNHPSIIELSRSYFEVMWITAPQNIAEALRARKHASLT